MKILICLFAAFFWFSVDAQQDWELIHGSDSQRFFECIFMTDTAHLWGASEGLISVSHDGGANWEVQFDEYNYYFIDLFFVDSLTGWAVGWSHVMKTIDGGENWVFQSLPNPLGLDVNSVYFLNRDTGWIAGSYQTIYGTLDGGENWVKQNNTQIEGSYWFWDIHFFDALHGCTVGGAMENPGKSLIFTTNDGGNQWTEIPIEGNDIMEEVQFTDENTVWTVNMDGEIYKSTDAGYTWVLITELPYGSPRCMHFFNESEAIIAGNSGMVQITQDGWNTWETDYIGTLNYLSKISFADNQNGFACGDETLLRTRNGGQEWIRLNERFVEMAFFAPLNGWLIQEEPNKNLLHSQDGGFSWTEVDAGYPGLFLNMSFPTETVGFILTDQSDLLKSLDAGSSWEVINLPFDSIVMTGIHFLDQNTGFLYSNSNTLYKTTNECQDWETFTFDSVLTITGVEFLNASEGWVIGNAGFLAHTANGGESWDFSSITTLSLTDVEFVNSQLGFILSWYEHKVFRTENGGQTWEELNIETLMPSEINFTGPDKGWLIDRYGLFFTQDGGDNWTKLLDVDPPNGFDMITDFYALDSNLAWLCTQDGKVLSYSYLLDVKDEINAPVINIFPNPVKDQLNIEWNSKDMGELVLKFFSIDGKLLEVKALKGSQEEKITLNLTDYSPGIYFLNLQGTHNSSSVKVIKI